MNSGGPTSTGTLLISAFFCFGLACGALIVFRQLFFQHENTFLSNSRTFFRSYSAFLSCLNALFCFLIGASKHR